MALILIRKSFSRQRHASTYDVFPLVVHDPMVEPTETELRKPR